MVLFLDNRFHFVTLAYLNNLKTTVDHRHK